MKVYIQSTREGIPKSANYYAAYSGFRHLGFETKPFCELSELDGCRPDDLIAGGIGAVVKKLRDYQIEIPELDYPAELDKYLGRKISESTLDRVVSDESLWPVFVKPVRDKAFTGFVLKNEKDLPKFSGCTEKEPVLCSEVVDFQAEWRVFVRYGKILDVRPYFGDWRRSFDARIIEQAVADYSTAPAGFAMDFGVTDRGETRLVEVNDGYSLGCYGLDPILYARLLCARWSELVGVADECDAFFEGSEWKHHRFEVIE